MTFLTSKDFQDFQDTCLDELVACCSSVCLQSVCGTVTQSIVIAASIVPYTHCPLNSSKNIGFKICIPKNIRKELCQRNPVLSRNLKLNLLFARTSLICIMGPRLTKNEGNTEKNQEKVETNVSTLTTLIAVPLRLFIQALKFQPLWPYWTPYFYYYLGKILAVFGQSKIAHVQHCRQHSIQLCFLFFKYKGAIYYGCIITTTWPWCSTIYDFDGTADWGWCHPPERCPIVVY